MKFQIFAFGVIYLAVVSGDFANNLDEYGDQKLEGIIDGLINKTINNIVSNLSESIEIGSLSLNLNQSLICGSANISNVKLSGFKEVVATKIDVSVMSLAMNATIKVPLKLESAYNASFVAVNFFQLFGDGAISVTIDVDIAVGGKVNLTGNLTLSNVTASFAVRNDAVFTASGVLDDQELSKDLSDLISDFLNEYLINVINDLISNLFHQSSISSVAEDVINDILKGGSKNQLYAYADKYFYENKLNQL